MTGYKCCPGLLQLPGDVDHVDDDGLDAIPLTLHLRLQAGHLVTVERVLEKELG